MEPIRDMQSCSSAEAPFHDTAGCGSTLGGRITHAVSTSALGGSQRPDQYSRAEQTLVSRCSRMNHVSASALGVA
eukprot:3938898-Rhodomonas_salina.3